MGGRQSRHRPSSAASTVSSSQQQPPGPAQPAGYPPSNVYGPPVSAGAAGAPVGQLLHHSWRRRQACPPPPVTSGLRPAACSWLAYRLTTTLRSRARTSATASCTAAGGRPTRSSRRRSIRARLRRLAHRHRPSRTRGPPGRQPLLAAAQHPHLRRGQRRSSRRRPPSATQST